MRSRETDPKRVQVDAEKLKNKFGDCSDIYAEERTEAAELAGENEEARHWEKVADSLEPENHK